jgi:hypothetical protein
MGKRIAVATIFGLICGVICMMLASSDAPLPLAIKLQILASRTLIGFAIGISALKMKWWLHGPLMGLIFSLPLGFSGLMAVGYNPIWMISATLVLGIIYGFIIELFTTLVFKAKA